MSCWLGNLDSCPSGVTQGWAVTNVYVAPSGDVDRPEAPVTVAASCSGVPSFWLGQHLMTGDQYRTGTITSSVSLHPGVHTLRVRVRAKVQASFACSVRLVTPTHPEPHTGPSSPLASAAAAELVVTPPALLPDVWWGRLPRDHGVSYLAVPVSNLGSMWLQDVVIEVRSQPVCESVMPRGDGVDGCVRVVGVHRKDAPSLRIAPGQVTHVPVRIMSCCLFVCFCFVLFLCPGSWLSDGGCAALHCDSRVSRHHSCSCFLTWPTCAWCARSQLHSVQRVASTHPTICV